VLIADQLSKVLTHVYLPEMQYSVSTYPYGGIGLFKNILGIEFSLSHMTNAGAAWGAFSDYQVYLLIVRIGLLVGLAYYLLFLNRHPTWVYPLTLILVGAFSNVIDFFIYGHVVDMLHFVLWGYDYPVFNIADSAVTVGVVWIGMLSLWHSSASSYQRQ
jgi:signal peptidase II